MSNERVWINTKTEKLNNLHRNDSLINDSIINDSFINDSLIKDSLIKDNHIHDIYISEIQNEYNQIDNHWLLLHYKISVGLVLFALMVECVMGIILVNSDMMSTTVQRFIWKFIIVPSGINFICIGINTIVVKSKRFSQNLKIYTVSLIFVVICFILFTAHNAFTATYYIFAIGIMLTTIYASYRVTNITALASIIALICSELFIKWDIDKISIFESTLRLGNYLISIFVLIAFSIACMVALRYEKRKNETSIQMEIERYQLQKSLQVDEMTGIFNRKALHNALKELEENTTDDTYILTILDIDKFKGINDNWGHHLGDHCLVEFARILKENCGKSIPFRYGGDEFCLLFRNANMAEAVHTCEQIQSKLKDFRFEEEPRLKLTASFGLAAYSDKMDVTKLFIHSDHALYQAKESRNAICVYQKKSKTVV